MKLSRKGIQKRVSRLQAKQVLAIVSKRKQGAQDYGFKFARLRVNCIGTKHLKPAVSIFQGENMFFGQPKVQEAFNIFMETSILKTSKNVDFRITPDFCFFLKLDAI